MSVIIKSRQVKFRNTGSEDYHGISAISEEKTADMLKQIEDKGQEVRDSIPDDYSTLSQEVDDLKDDLNTLNTDIAFGARKDVGVWERGTVNGTTGADYPNEARLRSNYISVRKGEVIHFTRVGQDFWWYFIKNNEVLQGTATRWHNTSLNVEVPQDCDLRVVLVNPEDTSSPIPIESRTTYISINWLAGDTILEIKNSIKAINHSIYDVTPLMKWEPGGIDGNGHDYDSQKNRLRTPFLYAEKEFIIIPNKDFSSTHTINYQIFLWNANIPTSNVDSKIGWVEWPNRTTIPQGKYFRILLASPQITEAIENIYTSILYQCIKVVDIDGENANDILKNAAVDHDLISYIQYDSTENSAELKFEPGGINNADGKDYDQQKNRLRTPYTYTQKDLYIVPSVDWKKNTTVSFKVFYWNNDWPNNHSSDSGWISFPTTYKIPEKSYFRILFTNNKTDTITDVYSSELFKSFNIRSHIQSIENDIDDLNIDMKPFVQSIMNSYPPNAKTGFGQVYRPLSILHFSDIHQKSDLWGRIITYANINENYIDFLLHTGDYCEGDQSDASYTDLYAVAVPDNLVVYNCVGNHDTYITQQVGQNPDKSVAHNLLFNHIDNWNVTFENDIENSMTYYKDFTDSNIRLIVLDNYYDIQKQCIWLASILEDARTKGLNVITAAHQATSTPSLKIDTTFQTLIPYEQITASTVHTDFDEVIAGAKNNGCKHIVHLAGHAHQDWFFKSENGVLNCLVECATTYPGWTEGARVNNTKSMDCFNIIGIDTELGILKLIRIGHNCDSFNRAKNLMSYDYINNKVLFNM